MTLNQPRFINGCAKSVYLAQEFEKMGWDAWTCDILPSEGWHKHIQDDILKHLDDGWDFGIFHPDCTYLANSGSHWLHRQPGRWEKMAVSAEFFKKVKDANIPLLVMENPIPHRYALDIIGDKYDQIIQPYQFGEDASKSTCLWLKGVPKLMPTKFIEPHYACRCGSYYRFEYALGKYGCPNCNGEYTAHMVWGNQTKSGQNRLIPSPERKANRSRNYLGISKAMAEQWGTLKAIADIESEI
jgi:hypothetical protein